MIAPLPYDDDCLLWNARKTAEAMAVSERTLDRLTVPNGTLPCIRLSARCKRYDPADVQAWIRANKQQPITPPPAAPASPAAGELAMNSDAESGEVEC